MNPKVTQTLSKAKTVVHDFVSQWNTPAEGNYVSYKEIINYSVGGMGRDMVLNLTKYLGLGLGNTLFGSVLGIRPSHIQTMSVITIILDILFVAIRAKIVDNVNTRWGRFRPWIALIPIPLFLIASTFVFLPFDAMTYTKKLLFVFCFSTAVIIVQPYLDGSITNLGAVITPNTKERTKVLTIFSLLYSLAPTIYNVVINVLADKTGGYTDIRTYRYIVVPVAAIGVFLCFFAVFGCKERFIKPKGYVPRANLFEGTKEIFKNKYWWLRTLSDWLAFMEWAVGNMFLWSFVYGSQNMSAYAVYSLVLGESATIAMLLTPLLLNKWGNRKLLVFQNTMNIVFLFFITLSFKTQFIFFIFWFLNSLVNYFSVVAKPVYSAEVNDYQQYISGKRLDGVMSFAAKIGLPITTLTGYFVPFLFESCGITTDYDILYEPMVRNHIFTILCVCSIIGAAMNLIPFFFYDFSKEKHQMIIRVLEYRVMLADNMSGTLDNKTLKKGIDGYRYYLDVLQKEDPDILALRKQYYAAKKSKDKEAIRLAKDALKAGRKLKADKKETFLFTKELERFHSPFAKMRIDFESLLVNCPMEHLAELESSDAFQQLVATYGNTKEAQNYLKKFRKKYHAMLKKMQKSYPNGVVVPDANEYKQAEAMPHETREENAARYTAMRNAVFKQKKYEKVMRFYLESQYFINEFQSSIHFDELESKYEAVCAELEDQKKQEVEQIEK